MVGTLIYIASDASSYVTEQNRTEQNRTLFLKEGYSPGNYT